MLDATWSIFGLLVLLGILVTFHEWGHYWVAKKLGVKALRFSVGFGKPFWSRTNKHGTEFAVAPIPLGGYVKFVDEREGNVAEEDLPYAFNRQPVWKRILIVLAGPAANFILAILVYAFIYTLGIQVSKPYVVDVIPNSIAAEAGVLPHSEFVSIDGQPTVDMQDVAFALLSHVGDDNTATVTMNNRQKGLMELELDLKGWDEPEAEKLFSSLGLNIGGSHSLPIIGHISDGSAAQVAGLKVNDQIVSIDNKIVQYWSDATTLWQANPQKDIQIKILRDGYEESIVAKPTNSPTNPELGFLGVSPVVEVNVQEYGALESLQKGTEMTWLMVERIGSFLGKLVTGKLSVKNLGGPVSIAQGAGQNSTSRNGCILALSRYDKRQFRIYEPFAYSNARWWSFNVLFGRINPRKTSF